MAKYACDVCNYVYDEEKSDLKFSELPEDWHCPVCNEKKAEFKEVEE